jgi:hypothetical protein
MVIEISKIEGEVEKDYRRRIRWRGSFSAG